MYSLTRTSQINLGSWRVVMQVDVLAKNCAWRMFLLSTDVVHVCTGHHLQLWSVDVNMTQYAGILQYVTMALQLHGHCFVHATV